MAGWFENQRPRIETATHLIAEATRYLRQLADGHFFERWRRGIVVAFAPGDWRQPGVGKAMAMIFAESGAVVISQPPRGRATGRCRRNPRQDRLRWNRSWLT